MAVKTKRKLGEPWHSGIASVLGALRARDRDLERLAGRQHMDDDDRDRARQAIHDRHGAIVNDVARNFAKEDARVRAEFAKRRRSYGAAEIDAAWRRVGMMLDGGLSFEDIASSAAYDREIGQAILANGRAFMVAADGNRNPQSIEREIRRIEDAILARDVDLVDDYDEHRAIEAEIDRRFAESAIDGITKFFASDMGSAAQISLGMTLSDVGFDAGQTWKDILDEIDPGWRATAERARFDSLQAQAAGAEPR